VIKKKIHITTKKTWATCEENLPQNLLVEIKPIVHEELRERVLHRYGHKWNDDYEQRQKPKRSLEVLKNRGIRIKVPYEHIELIRRNFIEGAECPILDRIKNMRIVTINGFEGSKMSLTIHDIFDHFWFYSKLERLGVLDRYVQYPITRIKYELIQLSFFEKIFFKFFRTHF
jgi:hypothetical protein